MRFGIRLPIKSSLTALLLVGGVLASPPEFEHFVAEEPHMGTVVRITAYVPREVDGVGALQGAFARVADLSRRFSDYDENSELNRVTREAELGPVAISGILFSILEMALEISGRSDGAFDVTTGALTRLQRRSRELGIAPSADDLAVARQRVGNQYLKLNADDKTLYLTKAGIRLDLGGIAKGYIADAALAELRRAGVTRALVAIAGDIVAGDPPPGEEGWTIRINPEEAAREILLVNQAISTSGDSERSHRVEGTLYSHIVDARAKPSPRQARAVSVIAASGAEADAWATALHVLGPTAESPVTAIWTRQ